MKKNLVISSTLSCLFLTTFVSGQDITTLYSEAVKLKDEKKTAEAAAKFQQVLKLDPNYTAARYELGWCQNDLKDHQAAIISLRKAREAWSSIPKVHFELGYAFEKTGKEDSAIQCYNRCKELKPDYSLVYKQLGGIAYGKDDYTSALQQYGYYELYTRNPITDYLYWYRKGFMQNATKNYAGAIISLEKSMENRKDYINTYLELGFAHNKLKQADQALKYFTEANKLDPKSHIPLNGIAEVYRDTKKDINEAMNWYKKTLALNPTERKACFGMGYCLNSQGKYNEAISYLKTAIEKENDYVAAYTEIGYSYYMTNMHSEAIIHLNKAMALNPSNENSRYYLGLVYIQQKNKAKAQQMVDELKKLSSRNAATLQAKVDAM